MPGPLKVKVAATLAGVLLVTEALLQSASLAARPIDFDVGPFTGAYLIGFAESEERPPVTFRWTGPKASIMLPLNAASNGSGMVYLRFARFLEGYARVRVYLSGRQVESFSARSGRFRTHPIPVRFPEGPVRIDIVTEDPDPARLGIAVDWIRLEGERWTLPLSAWIPRFFAGGIFLLGWLAGFGLSGSVAVALTFSLAQAIWYGFEPLAVAHVSSRIYMTGLVLAAFPAAFLRQRKYGRWVALIFLTGYLLKGIGIFHPSYFYADVRQHRRYVFAFAEAEGSIPERGLAAQYKMGTAYPRRVGEEVYAFPYSPVFFIPFTWLPGDPHLVEDALKHVSLIAGAAEVLAVARLGTLLFGEGAGALAALLAAFLPPMYSRLFIAYYPTIAAHLLDTLAIAAAASWLGKPKSARGLMAFGGWTLGSFLTYISSLFHLSAFSGVLALVHRREAWKLLAVVVAAASATIVLLYLSFTMTFFREILPALLASRDATATVPPPGLSATFVRLVSFYGYGYLAFTAAGLLLARKRLAIHHRHVLFAYLLSFLAFAALRATSGLFKDLKEILFVGPLVAVATAAGLSDLGSRGRWERAAGAFIVCGLLFFGLWKYGEYLSAYTALFGIDELD